MAEAAATATCRPESFNGLPCWRLSLPGGDTALVAEHGAHVLSWEAGGRERLFLSPNSLFNGRDAIRGGVPVCWPQFNARGQLPKHGFARNLPWVAEAAPLQTVSSASLSLRLDSTEATRAIWPHAFQVRLRVELGSGSLCVTLEVNNIGTTDLNFTGALHTYLAVDDVQQASLSGLQGQQEWDALTDQHQVAATTLHFNGAFDRVYAAAATPLTLRDGQCGLNLSQSPSWANTVVWTPGELAAGTMRDMPPLGHRHMLCVEAAQVDRPATVAVGSGWVGWQCLQVA